MSCGHSSASGAVRQLGTRLIDSWRTRLKLSVDQRYIACDQFDPADDMLILPHKLISSDGSTSDRPAVPQAKTRQSSQTRESCFSAKKRRIGDKSGSVPFRCLLRELRQSVNLATDAFESLRAKFEFFAQVPQDRGLLARLVVLGIAGRNEVRPLALLTIIHQEISAVGSLQLSYCQMLWTR